MADTGTPRNELEGVDVLDEGHTETLKRFLEEVQSEHIMSAKFEAESLESVGLRFLRARQFDIDKAKILLNDAFLKKIEHGVAERIKLSADENARCDLSAARNWYPLSIPGYDKLNRPILFEHTGGITPAVLSIMTTKEWLVHYHWWVMEVSLDKVFAEAYKRSRERNLHFAYSTCVVLDFSGLNSTHANKSMLDHVRGLVAIDNLCYPEMLGKMFVINTPWLAMGLWNLVKGWLDPRTQEKIEILSAGPEQTKRLLEYIDEDVLPECYGGRGPPFHVPKPSAEHVNVPRNGQIKRSVFVPSGHELVVDSYISDGSLDFVISTSESMEPALIKRALTGTGTPSRFLFRCPTENSDRTIHLSWINSSRFSTRNTVFCISVEDPIRNESSSADCDLHVAVESTSDTATCGLEASEDASEHRTELSADSPTVAGEDVES